jgi:hypothetical protein
VLALPCARVSSALPPSLIGTPPTHLPTPDERVALLGVMQALFEASMYTFVFLWTPALNPHTFVPEPPALAAGPLWSATASGAVRGLASAGAIGGGDAGEPQLPHGFVFAIFMTASMVGTALAGRLMASWRLETVLQVRVGPGRGGKGKVGRRPRGARRHFHSSLIEGSGCQGARVQQVTEHWGFACASATLPEFRGAAHSRRAHLAPLSPTSTPSLTSQPPNPHLFCPQGVFWAGAVLLFVPVVYHTRMADHAAEADVLQGKLHALERHHTAAAAAAAMGAEVLSGAGALAPGAAGGHGAVATIFGAAAGMPPPPPPPSARSHAAAAAAPAAQLDAGGRVQLLAFCGFEVRRVKGGRVVHIRRSNHSMAIRLNAAIGIGAYCQRCNTACTGVVMFAEHPWPPPEPPTPHLQLQPRSSLASSGRQ